jgi:uncharacterized membrane protein YfcA
MSVMIICLVSLLAASLTLFSGFGLGTIFMPAFALFFPIEVAVTLTAIVHLLNNILKFILLGKHADKLIVIRFGLPALAASIVGAYVLLSMQKIQPLITYHLSQHFFSVTLVKIVIAILMMGFVIFETLPHFKNISFDRKYLSFGGILSGFFGGLSGHQGALRSAFLIRSGLTKESFIATGVVIACMIDFSRIGVYAAHFSSDAFQANSSILISATTSAFLGTFLGSKYIKKITIEMVQDIVAILLFVIAILLAAGII